MEEKEQILKVKKIDGLNNPNSDCENYLVGDRIYSFGNQNWTFMLTLMELTRNLGILSDPEVNEAWQRLYNVIGDKVELKLDLVGDILDGQMCWVYELPEVTEAKYEARRK